MAEKEIKLTYIKVFVDYLDMIEPLKDAERGRLFTALLEYGRTGRAQDLCGNERYVFPMMKAQIDRDNAAYATVSAARSAARKGKRNQNEQSGTNDTFDNNCSQDKDKEEDEDYDEDYEKDKDNDKENDYDERERAAKAARTPARDQRKFIPPSLEDVREYCEERGNSVDPKRFVDYYTACGWKVGRNAMKDWQAAVRSWENNGIADEKPAEESKASSSYDVNAFFEAAVRRTFERYGEKE